VPWEYEALKRASEVYAPKKVRIVEWPVIGKVWLFAKGKQQILPIIE